MSDAHAKFVLSGDLDLAATVGFLRRGRGDPTMHVVERKGSSRDSWGEFWRAELTPEGPSTLRVTRVTRVTREGGELAVAAWGPGAQWSVRNAPALLGEHDDWTELDRRLAALAARGDAAAAALQRIRRRRRGLRLTRTGIVLEAAVAAVLEQKVTGVEARRAWRHLIRQHGMSAPGPAPEGLTVMPDGVGWRSIADHDWHRAGVGPHRMATIRRVAAVSAALHRRLASDASTPAGIPDGAVEAVQSIPGISTWTAAEILQRSHGDPDAVSVGDAHLPHVIGTWFTGDRADDVGMLDLLAPYAGHRQRVVRLITSTRVEAARFGAKATIEDHRGR